MKWRGWHSRSDTKWVRVQVLDVDVDACALLGLRMEMIFYKTPHTFNVPKSVSDAMKNLERVTITRMICALECKTSVNFYGKELNTISLPC